MPHAPHRILVRAPFPSHLSVCLRACVCVLCAPACPPARTPARRKYARPCRAAAKKPRPTNPATRRVQGPPNIRDPEEKPSCHKRTKNEQGGNYKSHLSLTESVRLRLLLIMFMAHNLLPQCLLLPASAILSFVWIDYVAAYDPHSYPFAASLVAPPACVGYTFVCLG